MSGPGSELQPLLRSLSPRLHPGAFVFAVLPPGADPRPLAPVATLCEAEGLTVVVPEATAVQHGLAARFRAAWITLEVPSDLHAVGLTAAFSGALAEAGISCNVLAGVHHDHLFVPLPSAEAALAALRDLQRRAARLA